MLFAQSVSEFDLDAGESNVLISSVTSPFSLNYIQSLATSRFAKEDDGVWKSIDFVTECTLQQGRIFLKYLQANKQALMQKL